MENIAVCTHSTKTTQNKLHADGVEPPTTFEPKLVRFDMMIMVMAETTMNITTTTMKTVVKIYKMTKTVDWLFVKCFVKNPNWFANFFRLL